MIFNSFQGGPPKVLPKQSKTSPSGGKKPARLRIQKLSLVCWEYIWIIWEPMSLAILWRKGSTYHSMTYLVPTAILLAWRQCETWAKAHTGAKTSDKGLAFKWLWSTQWRMMSMTSTRRSDSSAKAKAAPNVAIGLIFFCFVLVFAAVEKIMNKSIP